MAMTSGDVLVETLIRWGVDTVFGLPGDGINGVIEAMRTRREKIKFIHVRHEEAAAFAAVGYAKFTGKLGVCLATSGPGGLHLLNGLYDAKLDGASVLAITGMQFHDLIGTHTQQDVELDKVFMDVAVFNQRIMGPAHVENITELACRTAVSRKGVAHITIPVDVQSMEAKADQPSMRNKPHHVSYTKSQSAHLPSGEDLTDASKVLNEGRKIVIMAGRGALSATDELLELAELLGAPIVKPLLGKGSIPDESIYTTGPVGLLGTTASQLALEECDTLLMVGTSFPYIEFLPKPGQARAVQIDIDPTRIGLRYPIEVGLVGDCKSTLRALIPMLHRNDHRDFLSLAQTRMKEWWAKMREEGSRMDMPMKPQVVAWEIGKRLADNAIVACDSGTAATWWARQIPARRGQQFSISGTLATMACGLPYAIGAQAAYPGRQVIAFVGDGAFSMLMAEMSTAVQHKLPVKVFVLHNDTLGMIKWEQIVMLGNPEYVCNMETIDYAAVARACGATGFTIHDPKECGEIIQQALNAPGPVVVDCFVDPNEPPMPGKIKPEQAKHFAQAMARGEPERGAIIKTVAEDQFRQLI